MIGISVGELVIIFLILAMIGGPLWGMIDAARRPNEIFRAAGQSKALWIALQFLLAPMGTILYAVVALPSLKRQTEKAQKAEAAAKGPVWY
jgi:hypothetical protein